MNKGLIHIYAGKGKGKTTASFGLALRAYGQDIKVVIYQFLKKINGTSGEIKAVSKLGKNFKIVIFDQVHPVFKPNLKNNELEDYISKLSRCICRDFDLVERQVNSEKFDLVILDEILNVISEDYMGEGRLINFIRNKPKNIELILTGRSASTSLKKLADYFTDMKEIKHPFKIGIKARKGIEY